MIRTLAVLILISGPVLGAAPTLTHIAPAGGQRGGKVVVTCAGTFIWKDVKVWAPGLKASPLKESGKLEIEIPPDIPADRTWIRLHSPEGASAVVPFLVGDLPEVSETEPNNRLAGAKPLSLPVTVNGLLDKGDVDAFPVELRRGQTLVAALDANARLGSPMDAVLQVVSPSGIVVAENHDDLGLDPRLAHAAREDGIHTVRLFAFPAMPDSSIAFAGGAAYVYRLSLTTGPFATHAVPAAVPLGKPGFAAAPAGWNIPKGAIGAVSFPTLPGMIEREASEGAAVPRGARRARVSAPGIPGMMEVWATPVPLVPQAGAGPTVLPVPSAVAGLLAAPRARNIHSLEMKKGQGLLVTVQARTLGYPTDPVVRWIDPTGKVVTEADDMGSSPDPVISVNAAVDGIHTLQVADRFSHGSDRHRYVLTVRPPDPEFDLSVAADALVLPTGKPAELAVKVTRRGKGPVGPITIGVEGLPPGVKAPEVVSDAKGATAAAVTLKLEGDGKAWSGPVRVVGRAREPVMAEVAALVPARMGISLETVWLTISGK